MPTAITAKVFRTGLMLAVVVLGAGWMSPARGLEMKSIGLCEIEPPYRFIGWKDKYLGLHHDTKKRTCWPSKAPWCCKTADGVRVEHAHLRPNLTVVPPASGKDLSSKEKEQARSFYYENKPYARRDPDNYAGPASFVYNCHAFALHETKGIDKRNVWVTDPTPFYIAKGYVEVKWENARAGDVCLHYTKSEGEEHPVPDHSSVLVSKSDDPTKTILKAKMGQGCIWTNTQTESEKHWGDIIKCFRRAPTGGDETTAG